MDTESHDCRGGTCCLIFDTAAEQTGAWAAPPSGIDIADVGDAEKLLSEELLSTVPLSQCMSTTLQTLDASLPGCDGRVPVIGELVRFPRTREEVEVAFQEACDVGSQSSGASECWAVWNIAMTPLLGTVQPLISVNVERRSAGVDNTAFVATAGSIHGNEGTWVRHFP